MMTNEMSFKNLSHREKKTEIKKKTTCSTHLVKIEMVAFSYRRINGTLKII